MKQENTNLDEAKNSASQENRHTSAYPKGYTNRAQTTESEDNFPDDEDDEIEEEEE